LKGTEERGRERPFHTKGNTAMTESYLKVGVQEGGGVREYKLEERGTEDQKKEKTCLFCLSNTIALQADGKEKIIRAATWGKGKVV